MTIKQFVIGFSLIALFSRALYLECHQRYSHAQLKELTYVAHQLAHLQNTAVLLADTPQRSQPLTQQELETKKALEALSTMDKFDEQLDHLKNMIIAGKKTQSQASKELLAIVSFANSRGNSQLLDATKIKAIKDLIESPRG